MKTTNSTALSNITVVDLFAGIGAMHMAFASYGARIIFASEIDKDAAETYEANYELKPEGDITKIDANSIPDHDILCAGFPCQPFSSAGKKLGFEDRRGNLFFEVARIVRVKQPKAILLENVKNLVSHDGGKTFQVILSTLDELGYDVSYKVLNAVKFGIPQKRERIFILATRKDLCIDSFVLPGGSYSNVHLEDILLDDDETRKMIINRPDAVFNGVEEHYKDAPLRIGTINGGGQGERIYSVKGTAITLCANGGGSGAKTGLYLVNGKLRRLSLRECARVTGFPDSFIIHPKKGAAYKQFGNSIVVDVIQGIIEEMISQGVIKLLKGTKVSKSHPA